MNPAANSNRKPTSLWHVLLMFVVQSLGLLSFIAVLVYYAVYYANRSACSGTQVLDYLTPVTRVEATLGINLALSLSGAALAIFGIRTKRRLIWPLLGIAVSVLLVDGGSGAFAASDLFGSWSIGKNLMALPLWTFVDVIVLFIVVMYCLAAKAPDGRPDGTSPASQSVGSGTDRPQPSD